MTKIVIVRLEDMEIKLKGVKSGFSSKDDNEILKNVIDIIRGGKKEKDIVPLSDLKYLFQDVKCSYSDKFSSSNGFLSGGFSQQNGIKIKNCTKEDDMFIYSSSRILFFDVSNESNSKN